LGFFAIECRLLTVLLPLDYLGILPMHRFILPLCLLGLLLSFPVYGFFEDLDDMEQDLTEESGMPDLMMDDLIDQLEPVQATAVRFTDVPDGAWFTSFVKGVVERNIASGYRNVSGKHSGRFGPGDPVTIAQTLKMALRAGGVYESQCTNTPRLSQARGHWAERFVACAEHLEMRILRLSPDLDRGARRGEVLSILNDAFGDKVPRMQSNFTDVSGHPYESDIAYSASLGIVSGDSDANGNPTGAYRPNDGVNRAEASKMILLKIQSSGG